MELEEDEEEPVGEVLDDAAVSLVLLVPGGVSSAFDRGSPLFVEPRRRFFAMMIYMEFG